ncbi:MAG: hypothetical protein K8I82_28880 [Anaerolineae bacterium]|nr:hypothetical protein [Anaerolineae bacterium]
MRKNYQVIVLILFVALFAAACGDDSDKKEDNENTSQLGPLEWTRSGDTILMRLDSRPKEAAPQELDNRIPPCTLWGDGRLVWLNELESGKQVLEARLSDEKIRELLEKVIFSGFYDWQSDYIIPNAANPYIESMTLNLYNEERTVSRYSGWPVDAFEQLLKTCREISDTPVLFAPEGGWLTAYEVPQIEGIGYWRWSTEDAGFSLAEVTSNPRWITGDLAKAVWSTTIETGSRLGVLEDNVAYELVLRVPGISRDSPPQPSE